MKKRWRSFLAGFLCCLLAAGVGFQSIAARREIQVSEDVRIQFGGDDFTPRDANDRVMPVFAYDGSVYAPVRAICEAAGLEVWYDGASRTVQVAQPSPAPTPVPQPGPEDFQHMAFFKEVGSIQVRDGQGRVAWISEGEALERWLKRLDNLYWKDLSLPPAQYAGSGMDLIFFDQEGNYLEKFTDISEGRVVCQGALWEYYGYNLDLGRLKLLLAGKPDETGPEKLFDTEEIAWAVVDGGDAQGGKRVAVKGENLQQLRQNLAPLTFLKGEACPITIGCPVVVILYDKDGRTLGSFASYGEDKISGGGYEYEVMGGEIDWDLINRLLEELPQAAYEEVNPILTLEGAFTADEVQISNSANDQRAVITNPELVKRLAENMGSLEFRVGERVKGSAWDPVEDGRLLVYWGKHEGEGPDSYATFAEMTVVVIDEKTIAFGGDEGYYASPLKGKIDKTLLDQLMDPAGPYSGTEGVHHEAAGRDEEGNIVWP